MADVNTHVISGNITKDPRKYVGDDGKTTAYFTVAVNPPTPQNAAPDYKPEAVFQECRAKGVLAMNILETFKSGMAVIVFGGLRPRTETVTIDGRTFDKQYTVLQAFKAGPDITFATAQVVKNPKSNQQGQGFGQGQQGGFGQGQPNQQGQGFGQGQQGGFGQGQPNQQGQGFGQGQQGGFNQQGGFGQGQPNQQGQGFGQGQQGGFSQQGQGFGQADQQDQQQPAGFGQGFGSGSGF